MKRALATIALLASACVAVRAGPAVFREPGSVSAGGTAAVRIYDNEIGHFYDSVRPIFGAIGQMALASNGLRRWTLGPELGLDRFWTDEDQNPWAFRGVFVRGDLGWYRSDVAPSPGGVNYWGGGASILFNLAKADALHWGVDVSAARVTRRGGDHSLASSGFLFVEWP